VAGSCEHSNETSCSLKSEKSVDLSNDRYILKIDFALWG
jgi:hypothetical protein